jgi:hypothetical protein
MMGEQFEVNKTIIPLFIDSAKTYLTLSMAALGLSLIFRERILGENNTKHVGIMLLLCWLSYLLAIAASTLYQYLAIKFLDHFSTFPGQPGFFDTLVTSPGRVYAAMMIFFFLGSVLLVSSSIYQLIVKKRL